MTKTSTRWKVTLQPGETQVSHTGVRITNRSTTRSADVIVEQPIPATTNHQGNNTDELPPK